LHDEADLREAKASRDTFGPTGKMSTPGDVAHDAVFLDSEDAAYITGVCLPVDGGLAASAGAPTGVGR
jgi:NAD(P)-dependent dehydrogenase (short-subunit alcohol dehydrogenase family)